MSKQLSLSERILIERMIHQDYTFASIGRKLERSASTISREVLNYRCFVNPLPIPGENDCVHRYSCLRNGICPDSGFHGCYGYRCKRCPDLIVCYLLDKSPYVCTNCDKQKTCKKTLIIPLTVQVQHITEL